MNMKVSVFIIALLALVQSACSVKPIEPWVAPYEREHLADPIMDVYRDTVFSDYRQHMYETREGSRGGGSAQGSGCGCN